MKPTETTKPDQVGLGLTIGEFDKYLDFFPPTSNRRPD